jgi:hypothetical protein
VPRSARLCSVGFKREKATREKGERERHNEAFSPRRVVSRGGPNDAIGTLSPPVMALPGLRETRGAGTMDLKRRRSLPTRSEPCRRHKHRRTRAQWSDAETSDTSDSSAVVTPCHRHSINSQLCTLCTRA